METFLVCSAQFSYPVVISASRDPLLKCMSEYSDPRTTVWTLGPLVREGENGSQTGRMDQLYMIESISFHNSITLFKQIDYFQRVTRQEKKTVSEIHMHEQKQP